MKRLFKTLLTIVVAFTMISCATTMKVNTDPTTVTTIEDQEVDHSDDYTPGWNYLFPFVDSTYYIMIYLSAELRPLAVVAPINFFVSEEEIVPEHRGTWVWSIKYTTSQNGEEDGEEMGIAPTVEDAVEIIEYWLENMTVT